MPKKSKLMMTLMMMDFMFAQVNEETSSCGADGMQPWQESVIGLYGSSYFPCSTNKGLVLGARDVVIFGWMDLGTAASQSSEFHFE